MEKLDRMGHGQGVYLSGKERTFASQEIIVSKTDLKGKITYANRVFQNVCGYSEAELLGKPHSIVRHPSMPRSVFKLLWDTIGAGQEIFAYVINRAKNGDYYWVFAHVTPSYDSNGQMVGYHSSRRLPKRDALPAIADIYALLLEEERKHQSGKEGMEAALKLVSGLLQSNGITYPEFVLSL